jgi:hypothetical protein
VGLVLWLYGVLLDFLPDDLINLMRMGLPRSENGALCGKMIAIDVYESTTDRAQLHRHTHFIRNHRSLGCGRYILGPSKYATHLPPKFRSVNHDAASPEDVEVVVVHSDDKGGSSDDAVHAADGGPPK